MSDNIFEARNISFTYPDGTRALSDIGLTVRRGERLAVMGANGSGKSTFFLCLNGINRPDKGTLFFDGAPVSYSAKALLSLRRRVGIVFQDPDRQLFCADVFGDISFGALNLGLSETEVRKRVEAVMDELQIASLAEKPVHFLSGGEKKLAAIAGVLVMRPDVVILDEPTAALDMKNAEMVENAVSHLSSLGITVIMSTHDVEKALSWADGAALFENGRVIARDTPLRVFQDDSLLQKAHLRKPAVLSLFEALRRAGMLPADSPPPLDTEALLSLVQMGKAGNLAD